MDSKLYDKIYGCLLGGLIGDSMGGPSENMTWQEIEKRFGWIDDFEGCGTDDTAVKTILTDAIIKNHGYVTADEWAEEFLAVQDKYYTLYFAPVRNMYHKLQYSTTLPVYAGVGNSPSSSSAMAITPMGIINACDPRRAAAETYDVAGMMHQGEATFCRDGACAMAAAVAEALKPETTVDAIVDAAVAYLHKNSSRELVGEIKKSLEQVRGGAGYKEYRDWFYANCLRPVGCDSRETVPAALALFYLAEGDLEQTAAYAANFGRDSDTIGTMAASVAGAWCGVSGIRKDWVEQIEVYYNTFQRISSTITDDPDLQILVPDYREVSKQFVQVIERRKEDGRKILHLLEQMM